MSAGREHLLIWAHRGAHRGLPRNPGPMSLYGEIPANAFENTISALSGAAAVKTDGMELDIRVTADGEAVILHDATLDHIEGSNSEVASLSVAEIETRLATVGYRLTRLKELTDIPLPSETVLEWKPAEAPLSVWDKIEPVYDALRSRTRVTFSSFFIEPLRWLGEKLHCRRALLWNGNGGFEVYLEAARMLRVDELHLPMKAIPKLSAEQLAATGLPFCVYTPNTPADWQLCAQRGARAVFTDNPIACLQWRSQAQP